MRAFVITILVLTIIDTAIKVLALYLEKPLVRSAGPLSIDVFFGVLIAIWAAFLLGQGS